MHPKFMSQGCVALRQSFARESAPFWRPKREYAPELGIYGFQRLESLSGYSISQFSFLKRVSVSTRSL